MKFFDRTVSLNRYERKVLNLPQQVPVELLSSELWAAIGVAAEASKQRIDSGRAVSSDRAELPNKVRMMCRAYAQLFYYQHSLAAEKLPETPKEFNPWCTRLQRIAARLGFVAGGAQLVRETSTYLMGNYDTAHRLWQERQQLLESGPKVPSDQQERIVDALSTNRREFERVVSSAGAILVGEAEMHLQQQAADRPTGGGL
jgi:hypothetical protein